MDAYTRRIFEGLGAISAHDSYETLRGEFESALGQPSVEDCTRYWQEAHAVIVGHAKRYYGRRFGKEQDPLLLGSGRVRQSRRADSAAPGAPKRATLRGEAPSNSSR